MSIPRCHNRPEFTGQWFRAGVRRCADGRVRIVLRWRPFVMSQRCGSWSAPSGALPLPVLEGWECGGCRWLPRADVLRFAQITDDPRLMIALTELAG